MRILFLFVAALVVAAFGYVAGFRHGWDVGLAADAVPRGVISMKQLKLLGPTEVARQTVAKVVEEYAH